jgi:ATP-dependent Lon protease
VSDKEATASIETETREDTETRAEGAPGIPVLPLRDVVVYPHMVIPLFVGREKSIVALDRAMSSGKQILLIAQQKAELDDPAPEDLYEVGTVAPSGIWRRAAS